jgi:hypothetical protein
MKVRRDDTPGATMMARPPIRRAIGARALLASMLVLLLALPGTAQAEEPEIQGPLKGLPSAPGEHIGKIRALGKNEWLALGEPAEDPKFGRAFGRSWSAALAFAPDLGGAFVYGEGVHGYARPDGRYMDDLWFYDVNAHRWICCYPGADTKTLKLSIDDDGFEANEAGERIPVAQQVHAYSMNTYDTHRRRFLSMPNTHGYWETELPQRKAWLKPPPSDASPWIFDVAGGRWHRFRTGTEAPRSGYGDTFIYIPERKQCFFARGSQEVWFYDTERDRWSQAKPEGPPPPWGIDATSCYDPKRERIYIGGGAYPVVEKGKNAFWIYDLKQNRWIDPQPEGAPVRGTNKYSTNNALMVYEPSSDRVLVIVHSHGYTDPETVGIYVYDPEKNAWLSDSLPMPEKWEMRKQKTGFYHPDLNAVILLSGHDSRDDVVAWAYRFGEE